MDVHVLSSLMVLRNHFAPAFTDPTLHDFTQLVAGWIQCRDRHTISRILLDKTEGAGQKHHAAFYRFFSRAVWNTDTLGRILFEMLLPWVPGPVIWVVVDDSLNRRNSSGEGRAENTLPQALRFRATSPRSCSASRSSRRSSPTG